MRDARWDGLPFILETPMISGSLKIEAPPLKASKTRGSGGGGSKVEAEDIEVKIEAVEGQPNEQAATVAEAVETPVTLGASTWRMEIELLHELEKVPLGETNDKIDTLHSTICAIVEDCKKEEAAAKEARKAAKKALKEQNGAAGGNKKGKKGSAEGDESEEQDADLLESDEEKPNPRLKSKRKKASPAKAKGGKKSMKKEEEEACESHAEMSD